MSYAYPGSITAFPVRGYSIAKDVVGVKRLVQSSWLSRAAPQRPGKITTTNPQWGGRANLRIGGRSSDLLIGNQIHLTDPKKIEGVQPAATTLLPA